MFAKHVMKSFKSALSKQTIQLKCRQGFEWTLHQRKYMDANKDIKRNTMSQSWGKCKLKLQYVTAAD